MPRQNKIIFQATESNFDTQKRIETNSVLMVFLNLIPLLN